jgi:hypothetical protein
MNEIGQKVKDRLSAFIEYLGLSTSAFEKRCGLSNGYVRNIKGNLGGKKLEDILNEFPQLNRNWLLFGEGSMLKDSENQPQNVTIVQPEEQGMIDKLFFLVESQRKDIETLIQLVKNKDEKIEELLDELSARKKEGATSAASSSSASAV